MKIDNDLLKQIESDLGINRPFIKGNKIQIKNCWHFFTDGNAVDQLFINRQDFVDGMNRIFVLTQKYDDIIILAFTLMDTHVHFVIYGEFYSCNKFMHEYIRLTSMNISKMYSESKKLRDLPVCHQVIDSDLYLKVVIAYVIKNAPVGGLRYNCFDYPWSSGALYFRNDQEWTVPHWKQSSTFQSLTSLYIKEKQQLLRTRQLISREAHIIGDLIFPGDYVAWEVVESIYKTHKSYNYFLCVSKEEDVESKAEIISHLTIPIQEMRQHRNELAIKLFGKCTIRDLTTNQRILLAKTLKSNYNSSPKQIARVCGLIFEEVKKLL